MTRMPPVGATPPNAFPVRETVVVTPVNSLFLAQRIQTDPGQHVLVTLEFDLATSGKYGREQADPPGMSMADDVMVTMGHLLDVWAWTDTPGCELWVNEAMNGAVAWATSAKYLLTPRVPQPVRGFRVSANFAQIVFVNENAGALRIDIDVVIRARTI